MLTFNKLWNFGSYNDIVLRTHYRGYRNPWSERVDYLNRLLLLCCLEGKGWRKQTYFLQLKMGWGQTERQRKILFRKELLTFVVLFSQSHSSQSWPGVIYMDLLVYSDRDLWKSPEIIIGSYRGLDGNTMKLSTRLGSTELNQFRN